MLNNYDLLLNEFKQMDQKYNDYLLRIRYALDFFSGIILNDLPYDEKIHNDVLEVYEKISDDFTNIRWWAKDIFDKELVNKDKTTNFGDIRTTLEVYCLSADFLLKTDCKDSAYKIYKKALELVKPSKDMLKMREDKQIVDEIEGELYAKISYTTLDQKEKIDFYNKSMPCFEKLNSCEFAFEGYFRLEAMYYLALVAQVEDEISQEAYEFLLERYNKYLYSYIEIEFGDMLLYCHFMGLEYELDAHKETAEHFTTLVQQLELLAYVLRRKHSDLLLHFIRELEKKCDHLKEKFKDQKLDFQFSALKHAKELLQNYDLLA